MERSIFGRDRRRARRYRVHTPAYASLNGSSQGAVVELSEILNISESGMCIQASSPMKINRLLPLCLDLSATESRIRLVGHVIWSETSGKTGIRFPEMAEVSRNQLRGWIETNANAEDATPGTVVQPQEAAEPSRAVQNKPVSSPGYTSLVNEWVEIEKEVDSCGPDLEPALHLIAQRALTLTWASGTAIALINKLKPTEMVCRARAGTDSPEIGARLEAGAGFSGECVRAGVPITCEDTAYDKRVDQKSCRALGIRSIVACPVKRGGEVIGILEVFSPEPAAFWENDVTVLQRLTNFITRAVQRAEHARANILDFPLGEAQSTAGPALASWDGEPVAAPRALPVRKLALTVAVIIVVTVGLWKLAPWIAHLGSSTTNLNTPYSAEADTSPEAYSGLALKDLGKLAQAGNASAEYALGMRYATGEGVAQDYREAMLWFLRSADHGSVRAQSRVASWFWAGRGTSQDYSRAYFWALLAQSRGDETGRTIVLQTAPFLSPAQIDAEHKEAEKWLRAHHIGHASSWSR
jgi:putative methionine-R-sulfoxide reductase with GAF domain